MSGGRQLRSSSTSFTFLRIQAATLRAALGEPARARVQTRVSHGCELEGKGA